MAGIVYEYDGCFVFQHFVAMLPPLIHRGIAGEMSGGAANVRSVHLNIAGAGVQVQQHSAITDLALNVIM